ncbi:MAG: hypothetical protein JSU65_12675 [Candidatus Zixiibacteriota bacterium]|nr:MAG: hypothetical protein JSU65_12675 [candidate division Zixibacteria bacterium]
MKKMTLATTLVLTLATGAVAANSPIDKGAWVLGGEMSFQSLSGDLYECGGDATTVVSFTPNFGAFVSPGFMMGIEADLLSVTECGDTDTWITIGPRISFYLRPQGSDFEAKGTVLPYVAAFFHVGSIDYSGLGDNITITEFGAAAGAVFMASNSVGVNFGARFSSDKRTYRGDSASGTTVKVGVGITSFIY